MPMSRVNHKAMYNGELKQYFLQHRGDRAAFQAYLDRINQRPLRIIASPSEPDFDFGIPLVSTETDGRTWQEDGIYFSIRYSP